MMLGFGRYSSARMIGDPNDIHPGCPDCQLTKDVEGAAAMDAMKTSFQPLDFGAPGASQVKPTNTLEEARV